MGLTPAYAAAWNAQWRAFLRRERLAVAPADLVVLVDNLALFLVPLLAYDEIELLWNAKGDWLKG